jgi:hypothetical protein
MLAGDEGPDGASGERADRRFRPGRAEAGMRLRLAVVVSQCLGLML